MVQAKLWCPVQGGHVWVRTDWAHEFFTGGAVTPSGESFVPVRFIRELVAGQDRPAKAKSEISDLKAEASETRRVAQ